MQVTILTFGQITEITGSSKVCLQHITDTDSLQQQLQQQYPQLQQIKYAIAVDKKLISGNTALTEGSIIAVMPPFSGG